ncbi:MAG: PilZ domain-containing protein [Polyangiales bacterium]
MHSPIALIGHFHKDESQALKTCLAPLGGQTLFFPDAQSFQMRCGSGQAAVIPSVVVAALSDEALGRLSTWMRSDYRLFAVSVIALLNNIDAVSLRQAFQRGADDVCARLDHVGLSQRVAGFADFDPARKPETTRGRALVVATDKNQRLHWGRPLRLAGFDVEYALSAEDADDRLKPEHMPSLITLDAGDAAHTLISQLRERGDRTPCVFTYESRAAAADCNALPRVAILQRDEPPEHLLFLANELQRPEVAELRAAPRLLCTEACAFQQPSDFLPAGGLTYNVSRNGIYVRTLALPQRGALLWLNLAAPVTRAPVHLRGEVVWVCAPTGRGRPVPPGFGVKFDRTLCPNDDHERYVQGCDDLAADAP